MDSQASALLRSSALAEMRSRAPKHLWSHLVTCGRDGKVALYAVGTAEPPMARLRLAAHTVHPTTAEVAFVAQAQRPCPPHPYPLSPAAHITPLQLGTARWCRRWRRTLRPSTHSETAVSVRGCSLRHIHTQA